MCIRDRIKAVKRAKGMSGKPVTSKPVYGYLMDEDENYIVDEETAPVVQQLSLIHILGKETIDSVGQSENRGSQVSHGLTYQKLGKELMTQDELAVMDGGKCIFMLRQR